VTLVRDRLKGEGCGIWDTEVSGSGTSVLPIQLSYCYNYYHRECKEVFTDFNSYIHFRFELN
jgi:hypothetical protein